MRQPAISLYTLLTSAILPPYHTIDIIAFSFNLFISKGTTDQNQLTFRLSQIQVLLKRCNLYWGFEGGL
jgi:hypothetical protein